jgi:hypothetical protein
VQTPLDNRRQSLHPLAPPLFFSNIIHHPDSPILVLTLFQHGGSQSGSELATFHCQTHAAQFRGRANSSLKEATHLTQQRSKPQNLGRPPSRPIMSLIRAPARLHRTNLIMRVMGHFRPPLFWLHLLPSGLARCRLAAVPAISVAQQRHHHSSASRHQAMVCSGLPVGVSPHIDPW